MIDSKFWNGKKVFLTGHTGFKGGWLSLWLNLLGAQVTGFALEPETKESFFEAVNLKKQVNSIIGDIRNYELLKNSILKAKPDIVFHLAAQPLVRRSYREPIETYDVNVLGTAKLLEACTQSSDIKAIVNITTDKCYENKEWYWGYRENDRLGGHDPYSNSKACSELVSSSYRVSFLKEKNIGLATARAGNVIGGGDWSEDRLIPDLISCFTRSEKLIIRNPDAIRPWQHVLEPLYGYILLAEKLFNDPHNYSEAWNFGPYDNNALPVKEILNIMTRKWAGSSWEIDQKPNPHEAKYLKLDISKAVSRLEWKPKWDIEESLGRIIDWHQTYLYKKDMLEYSNNEIKNYMEEKNDR